LTDGQASPRHVIDINRILGPMPTEDVPSRNAAGLVAELDRIGIDAALVVHSYALYYDPATGNEELPVTARLYPVPVLVPGPLGTTIDLDGIRAVRLCPAEHGFALTGPHGLGLARELAERHVTVLLSWESSSFAEVSKLATDVPDLDVVLINTGYRALHKLADLLDAHPRLRVDTATLNGHMAVEWLAGRFGAHRVLFGTGAPVTDDAGPRYQLDLLDLPETDIALIAGGNAREVLGG
jgi:hypothetical protein